MRSASSRSGTPLAVELIAQAIPRVLGGRTEFAPFKEDVALVGMQIEGDAAFGKDVGATQVLQARE